MDAILSDLNARQLEAVTAPPGPCLVLAGPGSGKTHIIARRAAWLVATQGALPQQVLCVAFTNKAAQEMQLRLEALLDEPARNIWVYTFHAFCTRILRRNAAAAGLDPHFLVADEGVQSELLAEAVRGRELSLETYPPFRLIEFISQFKRNLQDPAQADAGTVDGELIALASDYAAALRARGLLDFDDLIGQTVRLLASQRGVRQAMQRALPHILVDEYQDINRAQFELLKLLAPAGHDVLAVADAAQSIYGWRGAQPALIDAYRRHYRPRVVELEENYRSTQTILFSAEHLLAHNDALQAERQPLKATGNAGSPIYHYLFANARQEQSWLTMLIRRLVAERGYRYGDIAILYRTHQLADELEGALLQAGIPIERVRRESFFQEPTVREVVRYLYLLHSLVAGNPQGSSEQIFLGALNFPQTLADELTILQLGRLAGAHKLALPELARRAGDFPELSPLTRAELEEFIRLLDARAPNEGEPSAAEAVAAVFDVLSQRRSPFTAEEYRLLREAGALLGFPEAAAALKEALLTHGRARLRVPGDVDGACAAAILGGAVDRYLGGRIDIELVEPDPTGRRLELRLPTSETVGASSVILRPPRGSLQYSLTTLAWRLAQELLMAYETAGDEPLIVYDVETTGVDVQRDEIVEIAAQRLEKGVPAGPAFYSLVRPARGMTLAASRVHGLTAADLQGAEPIDGVLPRFLRYLGAATVVGHNIARFDNRLIERETGRLYGRGFPNASVDTLDMAARLYAGDPELGPGGPAGLALEALLTRFRLAERQEHAAGADVAQTVALFQHLLRENALQRGLRALPEYLPLVAVGMAAAGVDVSDENLALWQGARRMLERVGGQAERLAGLGAAQALLASATTGERRTGVQERAATEGASADRGASADKASADKAFADKGAVTGQDWLAQALGRLQAAVPPPEDSAWLALQERFAAQIETFARFSSDPSLTSFLDYQALVTGADTTPRARRSDRVTLMTLHNAKGTEYPVVIVIGVEEEYLPLWTTLADEGQVQEERRVFYVGLTRAQRQLYLTSVRQRGEGFVRAASRFSYELPAEYVRRYQIEPDGQVIELKEQPAASF